MSDNDKELAKKLHDIITMVDELKPSKEISTNVFSIPNNSQLVQITIEGQGDYLKHIPSRIWGYIENYEMNIGMEKRIRIEIVVKQEQPRRI